MAEDNEMEDVSLMDLAGLDTSGLEAKFAGELLPKGFYRFSCIEADLKEFGGEDGKKKSFAASSKWKVDAVHKLMDKDFTGKAEDLIGKEYTELRFIRNTEGVQYVLGFAAECGVAEKSPFGDVVKAITGKSIDAIIAHRKDKNDTDKVYSGLTKIKAV